MEENSTRKAKDDPFQKDTLGRSGGKGRQRGAEKRMGSGEMDGKRIVRISLIKCIPYKIGGHKEKEHDRKM